MATNASPVVADPLFRLIPKQERPVPSEIGEMSPSDAAQGKAIVNPKSSTVFHGELS